MKKYIIAFLALMGIFIPILLITKPFFVKEISVWYTLMVAIPFLLFFNIASYYAVHKMGMGNNNVVSFDSISEDEWGG